MLILHSVSILRLTLRELYQRLHSIKIKLAADASITHTTGEVVENTLFDFFPSIKGKAVWIDARTIEFHPDQNLVPDKLYAVSFKLGKVIHVSSKYEEFQIQYPDSETLFYCDRFRFKKQWAKR